MTLSSRTLSRRHYSWSAVALSAMLVLSSCGGDGDTAEDQEDANSEATEADVDESNGEEGDGGNDADSAADEAETEPEGPQGDQTPDHEQAQATVTYPVGSGGDEGDMVEAGLQSLKVEGDVMVLHLTFVHDSDRDLNLMLLHGSGSRLLPTLNDRENLKQYTVLEDDEGNYWSTPTVATSPSMPADETIHFWAYYAAPEDDIDTLSVAISSGAPEFEDVVIEW